MYHYSKYEVTVLITKTGMEPNCSCAQDLVQKLKNVHHFQFSKTLNTHNTFVYQIWSGFPEYERSYGAERIPSEDRHTEGQTDGQDDSKIPI